MNKQLVVAKVIAHLENELELYQRAARAAFEEATDEQNKSESKYDTRGLEASYLARGQAMQVEETEAALAQFRALALANFGPKSAIAIGALVELEQGKERSWYLLAPCAGGVEIRHANRDIFVLTPQSPLGRQLMGRREGDTVSLSVDPKAQKQRIVTVK